MSVSAWLFNTITSTDTKLLPHSPAVEGSYSDAHLAEGFAYSLVVFVLATTATTLGCLAHRHRSLPTLCLVLTFVNTTFLLLALFSSRWFVNPIANDPDDRREEFGLFQTCTCREWSDVKRAEQPMFLSSIHRSERISSAVFAFFALFVLLGVVISQLLNVILMRPLLPPRISRIAHPFFMLLSGTCCVLSVHAYLVAQGSGLSG